MDTNKTININKAQTTKITLCILLSTLGGIIFMTGMTSFYYDTYSAYYSHSDAYMDRTLKQSATEYCKITEESFPEDDCETKSFNVLLSDFKNEKKMYATIDFSLILTGLAVLVLGWYMSIALSKK